MNTKSDKISISEVFNMNEYTDNHKKRIDTITHHIMAILGGFMACYAVLLRMDFIGNAQTSNMIYIVLALLGNNLLEVLIRVGGVLLYMISTIFFVLVKNKSSIDCKYWSMAISSVASILLSIIPENFNPVLALYPIFFAMAFQWNAFPGNKEYTSSTIFSTNNLRQVSLSIGEYFIEHKQKSLEKLAFFTGTILCFHLGVMISYFCVTKFCIQAIWFAFIPLVLNVVVLIFDANYLCENACRHDGNYSKFDCKI